MPPKDRKVKADEDLAENEPLTGGAESSPKKKGRNSKQPARPLPSVMSNANLFIDSDPIGELDHLTHARSLLSQVYYRQNMYSMAAQYCDAQDQNSYLLPVTILTGFASLLGFVSGSALMDAYEPIRQQASLLSGVLGVVATTVTAMRSNAKFDIKAESFRGAAGQYRLLATRLEARMREHRNLMQDEDAWGDPAVRQAEIDKFAHFFNDQYRAILVAQSEMKFFPPQAAVRLWKSTKALMPSEVDQPEVDRAAQDKLLNSFM